jgi:hypothetical protein
MRVWIQFFVGTPQRLLSTVAGMAMVYGYFYPQVVADHIHSLLVALFTVIEPLIQPVLTLMLVTLGLGVLVRRVWAK